MPCCQNKLFFIDLIFRCSSLGLLYQIFCQKFLKFGFRFVIKEHLLSQSFGSLKFELKKLGLFKMSQAIFVCQTNPDPLKLLLLFEKLYSLGFILIPSWC